jgi:hypothetical protein
MLCSINVYLVDADTPVKFNHIFVGAALPTCSNFLALLAVFQEPFTTIPEQGDQLFDKGNEAIVVV